MRRGQLRRLCADRSEQLLEPPKGKLSFRLNARRRQDPDLAPPSQRDRLGQQARLAYPWIATQHQGRTAAVNATQQLAQDLHLGLTAKQ